MRTIARPTIVAFVLSALLVTACSSSAKKTSPTTTTATTSTTSTPPTTAGATTTTPTTTPASAVSTAVWPTFASSLRFRDPVAAARSFATGLVRMVNPVVGAFRQGDSRSGEVDIRGNAKGPLTTVLVRQLGNDGTWWVLGSGTTNIRLTQPAALATITSPVRLRGTSTAFEATVNVSVRQDDHTTALAETFVMGSGNGTFGPFDATVKYTQPVSGSGALILYAISSENGHVLEATVIRVHFR